MHADVRMFFNFAKNGVSNILTELNQMDCSELEAVMNVHDINNCTIVQVLEANGHDDLAREILKTYYKRSGPIPEWKLKDLEILENLVRIHCDCSKAYIPTLEAYSNPDSTEKNQLPWATLKEGSYFLGNAYTLVKDYKSIRPGPIEDKNIKVIDDILQKLQFQPSHLSCGYTMEAYGGRVECFVSKAQGTEYYYKLLHSNSKKDVRFFIEMVKENIDIPVKNFLKTIKKECLLFPTDRLKTVIKQNNEPEVQKCIKQGANINFMDGRGETPLVCAVKYGSLSILEILLNSGADVQQTLPEANTLLHIAVSNERHFTPPLKLTECLLRYGVVYNRKNVKGETPLDVSSFEEVNALLRQVDVCFKHVENYDPEIVERLQIMKREEFEAVTQARNERGHNLLDLAMFRAQRDTCSTILKIQERNRKFSLGTLNSTDYLFQNKLDRIEGLTKILIRFSEKCLTFLKMCANDSNFEITSCPLETLREGSYYLYYAHNLVNEYKNTTPHFPEDANIDTINSTLNEFQFDPRHLSSFPINDGRDKQDFVSKAVGNELYYRVLSSKRRKDIMYFLKITERSIYIPAKSFLVNGIPHISKALECTIL